MKFFKYVHDVRLRTVDNKGFSGKLHKSLLDCLLKNAVSSLSVQEQELIKRELRHTVVGQLRELCEAKKWAQDAFDKYQAYVDFYSDWGEFEPYIPEEVSFEQFCLDWNRALAEPQHKEEESMGTGRYMRGSLPAEKRREQTRKAKERRIKRARPDIYGRDGRLLVSKGICHKKYAKAKAEIAKAMKAFTKKYGRFGRISSDFYYDFVREMKKDFPKLPEYLETVHKYEKDVKFAEHYGTYAKDGALIRPADSKDKELAATEEEAEKNPRHDTSVSAPVNTEPHIKSSKSHFVNTKEHISREKKGLKCRNFKKTIKGQHDAPLKLHYSPPSSNVPLGPYSNYHPYPYF